MSSGALILEAHDLVAGYGKATVLKGVSLSVAAGTVTSIIGPNGVGKSTLLRTLMGIVKPNSGEVRLNGVRVNNRTPPARSHAGLVLSPEGRGLFGGLSVLDNFRLGAIAGGHRLAQPELDAVLELFPALRVRLAQNVGTMSGGEQQMVAVGRSLMSRPACLMLDEPSLGLAVGVVEQVARVLSTLCETTGLACLIVEQDPTLPALISDSVLRMHDGVLETTSESRGSIADASAFFDDALAARRQSPPTSSGPPAS